MTKALCISLILGLTISILYPSSALTEADNNHIYKGTGTITQGDAKSVITNLFKCKNGHSRIAGVGEIVDDKGTVWTVPASNQYATASKATDLYEECANFTPKSIAEVDFDSVPVIEIDADGDLITGYIFADNYFELYINGNLVAVDSVPFTPFNSSVVKFKVSKPYNITIKVIDWEENLGLGTENNRGKKYHPGDGGFIASFSDGTVTNANWQVQTYYTAPIYDLSCLSEIDTARLSSSCSTQGTNDGAQAYAIHWKTPIKWQEQGFNYSAWPQASTYTEEEIGVNNKNAYMNFRDKFAGAGANFIWSSNIVLDNEVLLKYTVK